MSAFTFSRSCGRAIVLTALAPSLLAAQQAFCPTGVVVPYFGWRATECGNCNVYGSYMEYLVEPRISDIRADGPAAGKLREHDTLVTVDGLAITTPGAWRRLRDALPGDSLRFGVRRDGRDATATIVASGRCGSPSDRTLNPGRGVGRRPAGTGTPRTFTLDGAVVEVDGFPDTVQYDERTKLLVITVDGVVVRVRPRP